MLNDFTNDSRVLKISKSLLSAGYDVKVVAMYNSGLNEFEEVSGFNVHRIFLCSRKWPKLKIIQVIKFFEFIYRCVGLYKKYDIWHCNDLNALLVGVFAKLLNPRLVLIYDAHELEINDRPGQSFLSIKLRYCLEKVLLKFVSSVITVSDSIANEYVKLYGVPKPSVVLNCPLYAAQEKKNIFREKFNIRSDQKIFLYQGALSHGRGLDIILDVFEKQKNNESVLVIMGYGVLEGIVKEKALLSEFIFFVPAVSPNLLLTYTSSADFGISFIEDSCLSYRYCLPNKLFEYLMAGIPVLTSNLFEMKKVIDENGVGVVAKNNTVDGLSFALSLCLRENYTEMINNIPSVKNVYCWEVQEKKLLKVYDDISGH